MTTAIEPVRMKEAQIDESGEVLGRAFFDDPLTVYILPEDKQRENALPWFFGRGALYGHLFGEVYTTPGKIEGDAVWLPPGESELTEERMAQAGMLEAPARFGEEAFGRFMHVMGHMDELHKRDMPPQHWYLMILGVDPPRQGQGVGGALIQPVLARADAQKLPCYLETMKTRNLPFYRKHGFEVVVEDDIPGGGLHFWTMRREPR